ncbi:hypothetical protein TWF506_010035 [Arthrobotrys conoides]|uniref:Uncharacterized protein n=1 Tax=Arthrobotrys conoides TaxID=74498 RepID=A0AAN8NTQ2_9PEZI
MSDPSRHKPGMPRPARSGVTRAEQCCILDDPTQFDHSRSRVVNAYVQRQDTPPTPLSTAAIHDDRHYARTHGNPPLASPQLHHHQPHHHHRNNHPSPNHHRHPNPRQHRSPPHHGSSEIQPTHREYLNTAQSLNLDSQRQLEREILAMQSREAQGRGHHPSRRQPSQQLPPARPPPGLNASRQVPGPSSMPMAPPPGIPMPPQGIPMPPSGVSMPPPGASMPPPGISMPPGIAMPRPPQGNSMPQVSMPMQQLSFGASSRQAPPGISLSQPPGIPMPRPPGVSMSQPPNISIPQLPDIPQPQTEPQPPSNTTQARLPPPPPPNDPLAELHRSQRHVAAIIDTMRAENELLKHDRDFQGILFSNGILYLACPSAWNTCDCEFCSGVRWIRQYKDLDAAGERLWNDPKYSYWREYIETYGFKICDCHKCSQIDEAGNIKIPDDLGPDWNLWYGPDGKPKDEGNDVAGLSDAARIERQQPPKFRARATAVAQERREKAAYLEYLKSNGVDEALFGMLEPGPQQYHNPAIQTPSSSSIRSSGTVHRPPRPADMPEDSTPDVGPSRIVHRPPRPADMPEDSTPDVGPSTNWRYGAIGQPVPRNLNNNSQNNSQHGSNNAGNNLRRGQPIDMLENPNYNSQNNSQHGSSDSWNDTRRWRPPAE